MLRVFKPRQRDRDVCGRKNIRTNEDVENPNVFHVVDVDLFLRSLALFESLT
jgi:hypothetical protein